MEEFIAGPQRTAVQMVQLFHRHETVCNFEPPDDSPPEHSSSYSGPGKDSSVCYLGTQIVGGCLGSLGMEKGLIPLLKKRTYFVPCEDCVEFNELLKERWGARVPGLVET